MTGSKPAPLAPAYVEVTQVVERYVSPLLARSVIESTLQRERLDPARLDAVALDHFVERAMIGLRLFCEPKRLNDFMLDLAEVCLRHRDAAASRRTLHDFPPKRSTPPAK